MTEDVRRPSGAPDSVPNWDALARYVAGENSADDAADVSHWLDANPAERALLERLTEVTAATPPSDIDVEAALVRVHARMSEGRAAPPRALKLNGSSKRWRPGVTIGLLAAAAVVAVVVWSRRSPTAPATAVPELAAHTFATGVGQRDSVMLADGSRVLLGPDSRLTVSGDYATGARTVELRGDAYFDVKHDAAHPFAARVGGALVQDVGTTFTVESDDADATVVTVVSGSVRLRAADSAATAGVVLGAGQRGSIDAAGHARTERAAEAEDDLAWTTGKLVFRDAPMTRVAAEIHRWYGVRLQMSDSSLLTRHVTTTLLTNEPVDQVLQVIGLTLGARIDRQGDSAIVTAGRSSPPPAR